MASALEVLLQRKGPKLPSRHEKKRKEMHPFPTPISISENYFGVPVEQEHLGFFDEIDGDRFIDFAKTYLSAMKTGFVTERILHHTSSQKVRLFFDRGFHLEYQYEIERRFSPTPVLGHSPYPQYTLGSLDRIDVALDPLKKHLLVADEIYLEDNFYRCFDAVADSYKRTGWKDHPQIRSGVEHSLKAFKDWVRILAELKPLIETGALIFTPYYAIPSFPYASGSPVIEDAMRGLYIPPDPTVKPAGSARINLEDLSKPPKIPVMTRDARKPRFNWDRGVNAWLNARLLGLDPVFPDIETQVWASRIRHLTEDQNSLVSDLVSIEILPLSHKQLSISELIKLRRNEEVFSHVRSALSDGKTYLAENIREDASQEFVDETFRTFLRNSIEEPKWLKHLKYLDNSIVGGSVFSVSIGAACLLANPLVGLIAPAALSPKLAIEAEKRMNPRTRAITRLNSLF
ncbi:hypothetical protein KDD17_07300 [Sulfitobacter albidus]|uniref:Uncharacterized protein n=1 Tax=Sulfitobacter albidus TaxID=2829501 RepID=A0A975JFZ4_9RHOB|nr:hypothetical protein [Sulfitobacter albidus]QUJ77743.1 hypothetical protein KDD17_07300 [Sulfitobacter albidus]